MPINAAINSWSLTNLVSLWGLMKKKMGKRKNKKGGGV